MIVLFQDKHEHRAFVVPSTLLNDAQSAWLEQTLAERCWSGRPTMWARIDPVSRVFLVCWTALLAVILAARFLA
jgi:hypothetical protein